MEVYQMEKAFVEEQDILSEVKGFLDGAAQKMPLHEVERSMFRDLMEVGRQLLQKHVNDRGPGNVGPSVAMKNGDVLAYHSIKSRSYLSIFGEIDIARAYYWAYGKEGFFPLDAMLQLPRDRTSYLIEEWALADVAETTYDAAVSRLKTIFDITLWKGDLEKAAARVSRDAAPYYQTHRRPAPETEGPVLCATADCKGVRMVASEKPEAAKTPPPARLGKGEKTGLRRDAVVTADYSFSPQSRTPEAVARLLMRRQTPEDIARQQREEQDRKNAGLAPARSPLNKRVFASMHGKQPAFENLADRLLQRDPEETKPIFILIDGERSLETGLLKIIEERGWRERLAGVCLDIFHVTQYIWEAATALYGEKNPQRDEWVHKELLSILQGGVGRVVGGLRQILTKNSRALSAAKRKSLEKVIIYLDNHRHMMRYDVYLAAGYPIGTGVIEGACGSFVKERMDGAGKRWTRKGALAVLNLRATIRNQNWDDFRCFHIECQRQKFYAKTVGF